MERIKIEWRPSAIVKLVHAIRARGVPRESLQELALEALTERDEMMLELHRLRKRVAQWPKFQGMTELA